MKTYACKDLHASNNSDIIQITKNRKRSNVHQFVDKQNVYVHIVEFCLDKKLQTTATYNNTNEP